MKTKVAEKIFRFIDDWEVSYLVDDELKLQVDAGALIESKPDLLVITHCHFDHIQHIPDCEIAASEKTAKHLEKLDEAVLTVSSPRKLKPVKVDRILKGGDNIKTGKYNFVVLETPGHTDGSICLYDEKHGILFSGDTMFGDGVYGRTDLPTGDNRALSESVKKLEKLKVNIMLPGHD